MLAETPLQVRGGVRFQILRRSLKLVVCVFRSTLPIGSIYLISKLRTCGSAATNLSTASKKASAGIVPVEVGTFVNCFTPAGCRGIKAYEATHVVFGYTP